MECIAPTEVLYTESKVFRKRNQEYKMDLWEEMKKRWLVLGMLASLMLAVICPRVGASGGPLHMEYICHIPLTYVYFTAGRRFMRPSKCDARVILLSIVHAHVVAPALCVVVIEMFRGVTDYRLVSGVMLNSIGSGCAWLSLTLCGCQYAAVIAAGNYVLSLVAVPFAKFLLCGTATVPPLGDVASTSSRAVLPFLVGTVLPEPSSSPVPAIFLLFYAICCDTLAAAEGGVYIGDAFAAILLVLCWLCLSMGVCFWYGRCGLVSCGDSLTVALCSVHKCLDAEWQSSSRCSPAGLSLLPRAALGAAQPLLLALLATCTHIRGLPERHDDAY